MKKPSNKDIWEVDYTPCDLLVHDTQTDRAGAQGQVGQGLGRLQIMVSVDPLSRLVTACWLSYEETKSEH